MKNNFSQHQQNIQGTISNMSIQQSRQKSQKQGGSLEPRHGQILVQNHSGPNQPMNEQQTIKKIIQINNQYYLANMNAQQARFASINQGQKIQNNHSGANIFTHGVNNNVKVQDNTNSDYYNKNTKISAQNSQTQNSGGQQDAMKLLNNKGQFSEVNGLKKNLMNAGIGSSSAINQRKHSSVRRNHQTEKQTYNKHFENFIQNNIQNQQADANNQNQQWMTQTQPLGQTQNIEGGGSGGSGSQQNERNQMLKANIQNINGFINQNQTQESNKQSFISIDNQSQGKNQNMKKQGNQQMLINQNIGGQNQIQHQQNQNHSNMKNRPNPEQIMQIQMNQHKNQISRRDILQNNFYNGKINESQQAKIIQNQTIQNIQQQTNSVPNSDQQQKQSIPKSHGLTAQKQQYNNSQISQFQLGKRKEQSTVNETINGIAIQNNSQLINQQSAYIINQRFNQNLVSNINPSSANLMNGFNQNQQMIHQNPSHLQDLQILQDIPSAGHQKNKSISINGNQDLMTLHTKNSSYQIEKQAALEQKFKQEQSLYLNNTAMEQQKLLARNQGQTNQTQMTQNYKSMNSAQRQYSKVRKNVSNVRNPIIETGVIQNIQRVSQQRRFNNTTLDNYQQQINQQYQNFNLNSVQHNDTVQGVMQNIQTIQIQQALGTITKGNQSRSVLRQNQQMKQFRNNYLPANKYTQISDSNIAILANQNQDNTQRENVTSIRFKNQSIVNRNEIQNRAHSTLKTQTIQNNKVPVQQIIAEQNARNNNSQINNYLMQQNMIQIIENTLSSPSKSNQITQQKKGDHTNYIRNANENQQKINILSQNNENNVLAINNGLIKMNQEIKIPVNNINGSLNSTEGNKVQKSESEQSSAIHRHYLAEGQTDGRLSSADQDSSQMNQGGGLRGLHLRRNQPHNFSNVSEKSSLMGDYGGTHTAHNSNQPKVQGRQTNVNGMHINNLNVNSANSQVPSLGIQEQSLKAQNINKNNGFIPDQELQQSKNAGNMAIKKGGSVLGKSLNKSRGALVRGTTPQQQADQLLEIKNKNNLIYKNNEVQSRRGSLPEGTSYNSGQQAYLQQYQTMDQNKMNIKKTPLQQQKQGPKESNNNPSHNKNTFHQKRQTSQGQYDNQLDNQTGKKKKIDLIEALNININPDIQLDPQIIYPSIIKGVIQDTIEINPNLDGTSQFNQKIQSQTLSKKASQAQRKQVKVIELQKNNQIVGNEINAENEEIVNTVVNFFSEEQTHNFGFCQDDLLEEGEDVHTSNNEDNGFEIIESMQQTASQKNEKVERSESQQYSLAISGTPGQRIITTPVVILPSPNVQEPNLPQIVKKTAPTGQTLKNVVLNRNVIQKEISTKDQIIIKNNNVYLNADEFNEQESSLEPIAKLLPVVPNNPKRNSKGPFSKLDTENIVIQDNSSSINIKEADKKILTQIDRNKEEELKKMVNYETFESSSEDEFSCGAFESAAASFQNKDKDQNTVDAQEQKRQEKQRRKERKALEKKKQKAEQDRQGRKILRKKYRLQSIGMEQYDQYQDDVINYKDSERDSVISYFEGDIGQGIEIVTDSKKNKNKKNKNQFNDDFYVKTLIDTPTRLINFSNEFLPKKKKINQDKLDKKQKNKEILEKILNFNDIEKISDIEKSQKSTFRKAEEQKKDNLVNIVGNFNEIEKLKLDIKLQLETSKMEQSVQQTIQIKQQNQRQKSVQKQTFDVQQNLGTNQIKQQQEFKYKIKSNHNKR